MKMPENRWNTDRSQLIFEGWTAAPKKKQKSMTQTAAKRRNGFTLSECLCALLCSTAVFLLCLNSMNALLHISRLPDESQLQLGILQLREETAVATKRSLKNGSLILHRSDGEQSIEFHSGRIVKKPGYEIFLENIDTGEFYEEDGGIFLKTIQKNRMRIWQIF